MKLSCVKNDVSYRDYVDFIVIYNLRTKEICVLENVAAAIWRIILDSDEATIETICHNITTLYDCQKKM